MKRLGFRSPLLIVAAVLLAPSVTTDTVAGRRGAAREREGSNLAPSGRLVDVLIRNAAAGPPFTEVAPGYALARIPENEVAELGGALDLQVLPRIHLATDVSLPILGVPQTEAAGLTGRGTFVGAVDSGFDVTHPALRTAAGATRMAWLLDFSRPVRGKHPEIEANYAEAGCVARVGQDRIENGGACIAAARCGGTTFPCAVMLGAVYSAQDIDALVSALPAAPEPLPADDEGHGTLVMSIAAGTRLPNTRYSGVAPEAQLIGVAASNGASTISAGEVLRGAQFIFDRAKDAGKPVSLNLSLTVTFVVHDGTDAFGAAIATMSRQPGRVIVAAAGNSGDPAAGIHQTVSVGPGAPTRVALEVQRAAGPAQVSIIVSPHPGADLRIGCETPDGPWVTPVERGRTRSAVVGDAVANVIFNPQDFGGRLPAGTSSALVLMQGQLSITDHYYVTLEGSGTADLWIDGGGFTPGVREQTIGSPAMHPEIIAVGASFTRFGYRTLAGEDLLIQSPVYDQAGLILLRNERMPPLPGQVASFSGAGPGQTGSVKPELLAPGVLVVGAASSKRERGSLWVGAGPCPARADGQRTKDPQCSLLDAQHGAALGTSFASPFAAGAAAVLLQVNPKLTQAEASAALQAGAHRHRSPPRFLESAAIGELDVAGAVEVVRRMAAPVLVVPGAGRSWAIPNSNYALADGTRPLRVLFNLKGDSGQPADGFGPGRLQVWIDTSDGRREPRALERIAPGLWEGTFDVPPELAATSLTIRASFDGNEIVDPVPMAVARDPWQARYPSSASGASCALAPGKPSSGGCALGVLFAFFALSLRECSSPRRGSTCSRGR